MFRSQNLTWAETNLEMFTPTNAYWSILPLILYLSVPLLAFAFAFMLIYLCFYHCVFSPLVVPLLCLPLSLTLPLFTTALPLTFFTFAFK